MPRTAQLAGSIFPSPILVEHGFFGKESSGSASDLGYRYPWARPEAEPLPDLQPFPTADSLALPQIFQPEELCSTEPAFVESYQGFPTLQATELQRQLQTQANEMRARIDSLDHKIAALQTEVLLATKIDYLSTGQAAGRVLAEKQNGKWVKLYPTKP